MFIFENLWKTQEHGFGPINTRPPGPGRGDKKNNSHKSGGDNGSPSDFKRTQDCILEFEDFRKQFFLLEDKIGERKVDILITSINYFLAHFYFNCVINVNQDKFFTLIFSRDKTKKVINFLFLIEPGTASIFLV